MKNALASVLGGLLAVSAAGSAFATGGLLNDEISRPVTIYESPDGTSYDSATDRFRVSASLLATQITGIEIYTPIGSATLDLNFKVNRYGRLSGGASGRDLRMVGTADLDDDGIPEYSGTLLTGEVIGFGWQEAGATDLFDVRVRVTGGSMAGIYAKVIGLTVTSENSTFTGSFCTNFGGGAKGNIGNKDGDDCPRTPRSWKNNRCDWPVDHLTIGGVDYNAQQLYNLLNGRRPNGAAAGNDPLVELAQYAIAAKFSLMDGAVVDDDVVMALAAADTFLAAHPFGSALTTDEADLADALQEAIQAYVTDTQGCGRSHGCRPRGHSSCNRYMGHCGWSNCHEGWGRPDCGDNRNDDCGDRNRSGCR